MVGPDDIGEAIHRERCKKSRKSSEQAVVKGYILSSDIIFSLHVHPPPSRPFLSKISDGNCEVTMTCIHAGVPCSRNFSEEANSGATAAAVETRSSGGVG
jgi:hypothetical protein